MYKQLFYVRVCLLITVATFYVSRPLDAMDDAHVGSVFFAANENFTDDGQRDFDGDRDDIAQIFADLKKMSDRGSLSSVGKIVIALQTDNHCAEFAKKLSVVSQNSDYQLLLPHLSKISLIAPCALDIGKKSPWSRYAKQWRRCDDAHELVDCFFKNSEQAKKLMTDFLATPRSNTKLPEAPKTNKGTDTDTPVDPVHTEPIDTIPAGTNKSGASIKDGDGSPVIAIFAAFAFGGTLYALWGSHKPKQKVVKKDFAQFNKAAVSDDQDEEEQLVEDKQWINKLKKERLVYGVRG